MRNITWELHALFAPKALRHCRKCGCKTAFACSGRFRVNAQKKYLDVWLIYKCSDCDSTWNLTIFSRVKAGSLSPRLLERFYQNDPALAEAYSMDAELLVKNDAEIQPPVYRIDGETFDLAEPVALTIKCRFYSHLKAAAALRQKLGVPQSALDHLIASGRIAADCEEQTDAAGAAIKKRRIGNEITLFFNQTPDR